MLKVSDKSRSHFDQQSFQFAVCCPGNQGLIERIDHLLVIRDFMINVRLVERRTLKCLQISEVLGAVGLQALACGIVLRARL